MMLRLAALILFATALPLAAEPIGLRDLSAYLSGITTAEAPFTQINADGSEVTGRLTLHRPGRARFDYDGSDVLVLVGGGQVSIFDANPNSLPTKYPLALTPLNLILGRDVDLAQAPEITGHGLAPDGTTRVTAQDPERPENGQLTLVFAPEPTRLIQWMVQDGTGASVVVVLGEITQGGTYPAATFIATLEEDRRATNN